MSGVVERIVILNRGVGVGRNKKVVFAERFEGSYEECLEENDLGREKMEEKGIEKGARLM